MSTVVRVNLPLPSPELIDTVQSYARLLVCDPDKKRWLDEFHYNKTNSVLHHFDSPEFLSQLIKKEFQHIFPNHTVSGMIGIMSNVQTVPACLPPHCDRSRAVGLNYFINLGGNNVKTVFYDQQHPIVGVGRNIHYNELTPVEQHVFDQDSWYCYDVSRCHSVENIESTRLFIAIRLVRKDIDADLDFEYSMHNFQHDYPNLCTVAK